MKPWEASYKTRKWRVYKVPISSPDADKPPRETAVDFKVCGSDSEEAERLREDSKRFYYDWEQIVADLDKIYGVVDLYRLTADWKDHKNGALVLEVCAGVQEEPRCTTFLVEILE